MIVQSFKRLKETRSPAFCNYYNPFRSKLIFKWFIKWNMYRLIVNKEIHQEWGCCTFWIPGIISIHLWCNRLYRSQTLKGKDFWKPTFLLVSKSILREILIVVQLPNSYSKLRQPLNTISLSFRHRAIIIYIYGKWGMSNWMSNKNK